MKSEIQTYGTKPKHLRLGNAIKNFFGGWFSTPKYVEIKEEVDLSKFDEGDEEE